MSFGPLPTNFQPRETCNPASLAWRHGGCTLPVRVASVEWPPLGRHRWCYESSPKQTWHIPLGWAIDELRFKGRSNSRAIKGLPDTEDAIEESVKA